MWLFYYIFNFSFTKCTRCFIIISSNICSFHCSKKEGEIIMGLRVKLGCSLCSFVEESEIDLPFDCDKYLCSNCGKANSLSIIELSDNNRIRNLVPKKSSPDDNIQLKVSNIVHINKQYKSGSFSV